MDIERQALLVRRAVEMDRVEGAKARGSRRQGVTITWPLDGSSSPCPAVEEAAVDPGRWERHLFQSIPLILVLGLALLGVHPATAETAPDRSLSSFVSTLLSLLRRGEYERVAEYFHYPPEYSQLELATDRAAIARNLTNLCKAYGEIKSASPVSPTGFVIEVGTNGGDVPYWQAHPELMKGPYFIFRINEDEPNPLLLKLVLIRPKGAWQIQSFDVGIPTSHPNAKLLAAQLSLHMRDPL